MNQPSLQAGVRLVLISSVFSPLAATQVKTRWREQCTIPDMTGEEMMFIRQMNCAEVENAILAFQNPGSPCHGGDKHWTSDCLRNLTRRGASPQSEWEQRSRAALELCDQSWTAVSNGTTGDLRQAAQFAVDAWGGVLMRGHDCCVLLAAPYCYAQTIDIFDFSIPLLVLLFVMLFVCVSSKSCALWLRQLGKKAPEVPSYQCAEPVPGMPQNALDLEQKLMGIWVTSCLGGKGDYQKALPKAQEWGRAAATFFSHMKQDFGFQADSVCNQFEHLISLWRSHAAIVTDRAIQDAYENRWRWSSGSWSDATEPVRMDVNGNKAHSAITVTEVKGSASWGMTATNDRINAWFDFASKECFEDAHWEVAAKLPEASLSHRSGGLLCGHLIRFQMTNIFVEGAPDKACNLLVRPEVRGQYEESQTEVMMKWQKTLAPGDSMVERVSTMWVLRLASLLFGNSSGPFRNTFFYDPQPIAARHQLRRDFPQPGDCAYACFQDFEGIGQEGILVCRNLGHRNRFRVSLIFSTPEDKWPAWASLLFHFLTDMVRKAIVRFLNRPGVQHLRQLDESLYVVLCMRSFNRGPPLVPQTETQEDELSISISAGKELGLTRWTRVKTEGKFRMAEYMRCFLQALGHEIDIYESLEGRTLVPYQCVVLRSAWMPIRASFVEAFALQKAAYRRANGGTTAPSMVEDVKPHLVGVEPVDPVEPCADEHPMTKFVVRNTFLELEDVETIGPLRRSKSESSDLPTFSV